MNKLCCLIMLLFIHSSLFAQKEKPKYSFTFDAGAHFHWVYDDQYVQYRDSNTIEHCPTCGGNEYVSFSYRNVYSFQFSFLFGYDLFKNLTIKTGLYYFNHRYLWEGITDSILKYNPNLANYSFRFRYDASPNNIELPVLVEYNYKRLFVSAGIKFAISDHYKTTIEFTDGLKIKESRASFGYPLKKVFPTFRLSCTVINFNESHLKIYSGIEQAQTKSYDVQLGFEFQFR